MAILSLWRHSRISFSGSHIGLRQGRAPCFLGVTVYETWVRGPVVTTSLTTNPHRDAPIKDDGRRNLSLEEYHHSKIPRYAILSHTWEAEEVTFKDVTEGTGKDKAGYEKIDFCRKQSIRDGISYFWIDTCCIKKSSGAELTEAINSMIRWYLNADRRYVYLSDVRISGITAGHQNTT
jgi:hypothetical protein